MIRTIIADNDTSFIREISSHLMKTNKIEVVASCTSGTELCRLVEEVRPDAVLTDIVLQGLDGISAIKSFSAAKAGSAIIICTDFYNELSIRRARKYGASAFLCKPVFAESVAETIIESCSALKGGITSDDFLKETEYASKISGNIASRLVSLGIPQDSEGFRYLCDAVELVRKEPEMISSVTKLLYPALARLNSTSPSRAERNIRTAISKACKIGGFNINGHRPTNREMIAYLVSEELA